MVAVRALVLAVLLALCAPGAAWAARETASSGAVEVSLSYARDAGALQARDVRLSITRDGVPALRSDAAGLACMACRGAVPIRGIAGADTPSLTVRDLDADGDPEVLLELYTGGAHCCSVTVLYRWDGTRYRRSSQYWGNYGFRLGDLGRDGRVEVLAFDERFVYAFCAYVCSAAPSQVLRLTDGRLRDVTREFPERAARDADALRRALRSLKGSERPAIKGVLPAYCALEYLAGRGARCIPELERALRRGDLRRNEGDLAPSGRAYVRAVLRFLSKTGYRS